MKQISLILLISIAGSGCFGYSAKNNELIGQVKKVISVTPLLCPDRSEVDVSLGVMRNGVGSMSHEDFLAVIEDPTVMRTLKKAAETGSLIKVNYDTKRVVLCPHTNHVVTSAETIQ